MASVREWQFKRKFRTNAYGWRASSLAIGRLKEAAAEIKSVAKSDPIAAGDGIVWLMERIWPAFQGIDTSSGALGAAVLRTVNELIPILTVASADHATRGKWLERLFEAVQSDGVEYLARARISLGRDRPIPGPDQRIRRPNDRHGTARLGRSPNLPACDRNIRLLVVSA